MKTRIALILVLTLVSMLNTACAHDDSECTDPKTGHGVDRIVAFGDSQTAGHAQETSKGCGYSYANILSERHSLSLVNLAVAGSMFTSNDQYGRIMGTTFLPTDRVIFSVGFNDMANFKSDAAHLAEFKAKLKTAIALVAPQVQQLTIGTAFKPYDWRYSDQASLDAYRAAAHEAVTEAGLSNVTIGEVGDSISGKAQFYVSDTYHYNFTGQAVLADDFELIF